MSPENDITANDVCHQHSGMVQMVANNTRTMGLFSDNIETLFEKFDKLSEKFEGKIIEYAQRPTWFVCTVISSMSGIIGVLVTFILYTHFSAR